MSEDVKEESGVIRWGNRLFYREIRRDRYMVYVELTEILAIKEGVL